MDHWAEAEKRDAGKSHYWEAVVLTVIMAAFIVGGYFSMRWFNEHADELQQVIEESQQAEPAQEPAAPEGQQAEPAQEQTAPAQEGQQAEPSQEQTAPAQDEQQTTPEGQQAEPSQEQTAPAQDEQQAAPEEQQAEPAQEPVQSNL